MKAWLIRRDVASVKGHLGDVFDTKEAAEWAVYYDKGNHNIIEIDLPDPPHEWKVNDWADFDDVACRIVDIANEWVVFHFRDEDGGPQADWVSLVRWSRDATPCDPPEWWTA